MSFQAYLDNIKEKTGKTANDFHKLAEKNGLLEPGVKAGEIVKWLKEDFELGHGHAMAIYTAFKSMNEPVDAAESKIEKHFSGKKEVWLKSYNALIAKVQAFGNDVKVAPTSTYLSITRGDKKIAVIQVVADRMDIGIKLKDMPPTDRLELSGTWNSLVTHRVKITDAKQVDKELLGWLKNAYEQTIKKK